MPISTPFRLSGGRAALCSASALLAFGLAVSCRAQQSGTVSGASSLKCDSFNSRILGRSVNYCVDLPAGYDSQPAKRYPVLYFLHGLFENEQSWGEKGGKQILDRLRAAGKVGNFIVVIPDGGHSFYINSYDGRDRYEDFFTQEFVPAMDRLYRTIPVPQERAVSGTSMGGFGALHLAMRHASLFGAGSAQGAALIAKFPNPLPSEGRWAFYARILSGTFGSPLNESYWDANSPLTLAEQPNKFEGLKLYFDCGDHDRYGFNAGAGLLDQILTREGYPHQYVLRDGDHGWAYLEEYMQYDLEFHWKAFQTGLPAGSKSEAGGKGGR